MDKTTKVLLAAIALGLWANAIPKATAQYDVVSAYLKLIQQDIGLMRKHIIDLTDGRCRNKTLCDKALGEPDAKGRPEGHP